MLNIDQELAAILSIRACFDDLVAHSQRHDEAHLLVPLDILRDLQARLERLHEDLHEAAVAAENNAKRGHAA